MDRRGQAVAKICRFIIHQTLDDNSSCSTDVVTLDDDNSSCSTDVVTLDDNSSCSTDVVTLGDSSSCLTDVVAEFKEFLIATTYHDSHAISIQVEDKDQDPPSADNDNYSKSSDNDNKNNAKVKEIATEKTSEENEKKLEFFQLLYQQVCIQLLSDCHVQTPAAGDGISHYCSNHSILLVGEGDFSFSACLAKAFGSADNMVATSLNSLGFLEKNYLSAKTNIGFLRNRGGTVLHEVDATNMEFNILVNEYIYDRIIFNFPLAGFFNESRRQHLKRNRKLVRSFMKNAKNLMASDGEIHIRHKTSPMYQEWGIENLAKQCGLKLIEEVEFKLSHYPGYHNKYGFGGNGDFNCHPSKTYKFGFKQTF